MHRHTADVTVSVRSAVTAMLISIASLGANLPVAQAEIFYKWQDDTGTWVYGAHPPGDVEAIEVKTTTGRPSHSESTGLETAKKAPKSVPEDAERQLLVEKKPQLSPEQRREYCERAKANLDALSSKAVIRQRDAAGKVTELSEADRQLEIDKANIAISQFCD